MRDNGKLQQGSHPKVTVHTLCGVGSPVVPRASANGGEVALNLGGPGRERKAVDNSSFGQQPAGPKSDLGVPVANRQSTPTGPEMPKQHEDGTARAAPFKIQQALREACPTSTLALQALLLLKQANNGNLKRSR